MALCTDVRSFAIPQAAGGTAFHLRSICGSTSSSPRSHRAAGALLVACLAFAPGARLLGWLGRKRHRKARVHALVRDTSPNNVRWKLAAQGTPLPEDDPDGQLKQQVEDLWEDLEPKLMYLPRDDRLRALSGLCVAALAHKGQRRKSGEPYIVHPVAVAELLALLKVQVDVIISGLLHDTVEDNDDIRFEDLESIFGLDVRRIVEGETKASKRTALGGRGNWSRRYTSLFNKFLGNGENKDSSPPKEMGKAQEQAENLRDMFLAMADDYRVILVKLADRLHNMRTLQYMPEIKQKTIAAETLVVFSQLAHRLGVWLFKTELEDLSFQYLYPTEFRTLNQLLSMRHAQHQSTLQAATHDFSNLLRHDPIFIEQNVRIEITGRAKGMYSLWEKMRRKPKYHNNIDNIDDIIALRIVLDIDQLDGESDDDYASRGAKLCNHALALARKLPKWSGGEGLKNYIAFPKPNGYQSLHVTFIHDDAPVPLEIQIRTRQMHEVAEYGMAAHWIYKSGQRGKPQKAKKQSRRVAWLESLADKDWELRADPQAFVQEVLRDELGKRCFVFLRDGTILNLSRGCTALDAAFKIHSEVGMHMLYPEINDKQVPPFYELQNGDRVNIVTAEDAVPQREWLACAFLRSTRNRLSARFRKQSKEKDRAVDLAAALATAATAAAALPLVH